MRLRAVLAGGTLLIVTACGMGGNKGEVCKEAAKDVTGFNGRLSALPPDDIRSWRQASADFAGQLETLAKKSDNGKLTKTLSAMATEWRGVSTGIAPSDISKFTGAIQRQPAQLAGACH